MIINSTGADDNLYHYYDTGLENASELQNCHSELAEE